MTNTAFLTRAADGLPRRGFTNADVARMLEAGVLDGDELFELIEGEIVPMAAEMDRHARARWKLQRIFHRALGESWFVATEASLFLNERIEFRPDLHVFSAAMLSHLVRGPDVALVVELASTTQDKDFTTKAPLYRAHGVKELWLIDLDARTGLIVAEGAERKVSERDALTPRAFPEISLTIADLY